MRKQKVLNSYNRSVKSVKSPDSILRYQENSAILLCGKVRFAFYKGSVFSKETIQNNRPLLADKSASQSFHFAAVLN